MAEHSPQRGKVIAYLKSLYPYATDTFVRREVLTLRELGYTVHPFSVRRPAQKMIVSQDIADEQALTEYLYDGAKLKLIVATLLTSVLSPLRMLAALRLSQQTSAPGIKARLWQIGYLMEAALLARRMKSKGVSHLHNHIGQNSASVAMLASVLSGIRYSLTIHGPKEFDQPEYIALGEKLKRAAFAVAISEFGRSQLFRWCPHGQWDKIHVVHCGVDGEFLGRTPSPVPEAQRLTCVGRLCPEKGQLLLIEAARRLKDEGLRFELILIGDGESRAELESLISRQALQDTVRITGWMASPRVREQIELSRAMVLPSFAEGLPVVIMEALALHRPVISTYIAGIPELVETGVCGWLVPPGSIEALVDAMRDALTSSPDKLAQLGKAGAARVAEHHNAAVEAAKLAKLIDRYAV
jgi:colanic acid/amylovoran biosynthesis glycosyltransferase